MAVLKSRIYLLGICVVLMMLLIPAFALAEGSREADVKAEQEATGEGEVEQIELKFIHTKTTKEPKYIYNTLPKVYEMLHPNVKINVTVQEQQTYEDMGLDAMIEGSDPPDIYTLHGDYEVMLKKEAGYAADITDLVEPWKDRFLEGALTVPMIEGRLYGLPREYQAVIGVWYNKGLYEKYGFEEAETWDQWMQQCQTLKDDGITPFAFGNSQLHPFGNFASLVVARIVGVEKWDAVMRMEEKFSQPEMLKAMKFIEQEFAEPGFVSKDMNTIEPAQGHVNWMAGEAAFDVSGSWVLNYAADAPEGFEFDVFALPPVPDGKGDPHMQEVTIANFVVNAKSEHIDVAVDFLNMFTNPYMAKWQLELGQLIPVKEGLEQAEIDPRLAKMIGFGDLAEEIIGAPDEYYKVDVANTFYEALARVAVGEMGAEAALNWVDKQLEPLR